MQRYRDQITDKYGNGKGGLSVRVQTYPGGVDATIYSDNISTVAVNPLTTDVNGEFSFYAADGAYQLVVSGTGITTRTITDVRLDDPAVASALTVSTLTTTGQITAADGSTAAPAYSFSAQPGNGIYRPSSNALGVVFSGTEWVRFTPGATTGLNLRPDIPLSWGTIGTPDVFLARDAANTLAQRNGTNAQWFNIYNTYSDAANYERLMIRWNSLEAQILQDSLGTGTARTLKLGTIGASGISFVTTNVARWGIQSTGHIIATTDNTLDIGANGATRPRTGYFGTSVFTPVVDSGAASNLDLRTNNGTKQAMVFHVASAVNFLQFGGAATGGTPHIGAVGGDTDVSLNVFSKGSGGINFRTNGNAVTQLSVIHIASAVNFVQVSGGATGAWPRVSANGADTDIGLLVSSKGAAAIEFDTNGTTQQFRIAHTASAVNYLQVTGNVTTASPVLSAQGSDANVTLVLASKGNGNISLRTAGGSEQFRVVDTASVANWVQVTGAAAGSAPIVIANGADANIDLALLTKGTGVVKFGIHTVKAAEAFSGYITIKDSGGTVRKVMVCS